eukprot:NODE_6960_length_596_cov_2.605119_g5965_i0.p1 GENE.NODE_6960_length_596_cov_2.605119_g5965_i0~~NODE_6960_length_596_cov_2.605119_g5965_i0.p1  ORF type:complete len:108 (-),score=4.50 NODE_6960_length_596_cov_2.605119_g5965_i0:271-594(-)
MNPFLLLIQLSCLPLWLMAHKLIFLFLSSFPSSQRFSTPALLIPPPHLTSPSRLDVIADHEASKIRKYDARIRRVEHGDFCPLVSSVHGSLGPAAQRALSVLVGPPF